MFTKESIRKRRDEGIEQARLKDERRLYHSLYPGMKKVKYNTIKKSTIKKAVRIDYNSKKYPEAERFIMLKHRAMNIYEEHEERIAFIDFFYYDEQFNTVFNFWVACDRYKDFVPSVDHKISKVNGGSDELDNLHFITYAENMWKSSMNWEEWCQFKIDMHLTADFFISWR